MFTIMMILAATPAVPSPPPIADAKTCSCAGKLPCECGETCRCVAAEPIQFVQSCPGGVCPVPAKAATFPMPMVGPGPVAAVASESTVTRHGPLRKIVAKTVEAVQNRPRLLGGRCCR